MTTKDMNSGQGIIQIVYAWMENYMTLTIATAKADLLSTKMKRRFPARSVTQMNTPNGNQRKRQRIDGGMMAIDLEEGYRRTPADEIMELKDKLVQASLEAEEDYRRKKKAKGEEVIEENLCKAVNQRKKVRDLSKRAWAALCRAQAHIHPTFEKMADSAEEEVREDGSNSK